MPRPANCLRSAAVVLTALFASCGSEPPNPAPNSTPGPVPKSAPSVAKSGYHYQSSAEQTLQDDAFANPGYLWIDEGEILFQSSCTSCHTQNPQNSSTHNWRTAATRYPTYDKLLKRVINLEERINQCRTRHQSQPPYPWESQPLLALTAYVAHQAQGKPIAAAQHAADITSSKRGETYYQQRKGQLNLACGHCHELNAGKMLRGDRLSQGLPTGYPAYKLEWQTLGSLQRRLRDCDAGVRAERWSYGTQVYVDVERYLKDRATGLVIETPAVRR